MMVLQSKKGVYFIIDTFSPFFFWVKYYALWCFVYFFLVILSLFKDSNVDEIQAKHFLETNPV